MKYMRWHYYSATDKIKCPFLLLYVELKTYSVDNKTKMEMPQYYNFLLTVPQRL